MFSYRKFVFSVDKIKWRRRHRLFLETGSTDKVVPVSLSVGKRSRAVQDLKLITVKVPCKNVCLQRTFHH